MGDLSLSDHLEELRGRLIKALISVFIATCLFYAVVDKIFLFVIKPVGKLVFTAPAEAFVARIMLSIFGGVFLALPVLFYQIWRFIGVGLTGSERKYILIFAPCSFLLFLVGMSFAYFVAAPISIRFFLSFSSDWIVPMITVKSYISFVGVLVLSFGAIFELPLVLMFLTKVGIVKPVFLKNKRRYAVVLILIVSALITPPDFITQLIMAVPLIGLYEIGILASSMIKEKV